MAVVENGIEYCDVCGDELEGREVDLCSYCRALENDDEDLIDGVGFANEGSALRAETGDNPRDRPCPTCGTENVLTRIDEAMSYQCNRCANAAERGLAWDEF